MQKPIIINPDLTIFVMRDAARYSEARDLLLRCAQLDKSPGHVQVYSITPLSLWNAAALGVQSHDLLQQLAELAQFPVPEPVSLFITEMMARWGAIYLRKVDSQYVLDVTSPAVCTTLLATHELRQFFSQPVGPDSFIIDEGQRGPMKLALIEHGVPVVDLAGYCDGDPLFDAPCDLTAARTFTMRDYQSEAVASFLGTDPLAGGNGVIVLPCGAGKTMVGAEILLTLKMKTLILTTNVVAAKQWRTELITKFGVPETLIGEYHGETKEIRPITIATYQILTRRDNKSDQYEHLALAGMENWGLVVYDEVHTLPADLFRMTSQLQARRRLGLTATLVREDQKEPHVFSLIGPKRYEVPWRILEQQGWIAKARCYEIRVPFSATDQAIHDAAKKRERFHIAAVNKAKIGAIEHLLSIHPAERVLVIGTFVDHIHTIAKALDWPILDGSSPQKKRDAVFGKFRSGEIRGLVLSKIANTSIDLPDASMVIQVSGQFGSRQEEAQRLGRALRPKAGENQALFYSLVTHNSAEVPFAENRQKFLLEQGYGYERASLNTFIGRSLQGVPGNKLSSDGLIKHSCEDDNLTNALI